MLNSNLFVIFSIECGTAVARTTFETGLSLKRRMSIVIQVFCACVLKLVKVNRVRIVEMKIQESILLKASGYITDSSKIQLEVCY